MKVRLVASDLDGTIIGEGNSISARTIAAFQSCAEAGIEVVFVTGRPKRWIWPLRESLGHLGTVICSNGAVVYDLGTETVIGQHVIARDAAREVLHRIRAAHPDALFAMETLDLPALYVDPGFVNTSLREQLQLEERPVDEALEHSSSIVKILAKSPDSTPDEFLSHVDALVSDLVTSTHSSPVDALVEMGPHKVDKAVTLASFAAERGIGAEEVVAFGDMPNDIPMLCWAGRGYAVSSGHPTAISSTRYRTPPFQEDGVAQVLESLLEDVRRP
ncbi:HAD family hydrolase [Haematomicrobium sanguinis]|uniref:HAD family hydrolase n=1 Tax=Haematomicrobium sanguinis TaxID=479106 RepID=UPI00047B621D|nr:HAD family hydrolase [Haematomicrobium sanguinis]